MKDGRFSDFIVREVDGNGKVVRLTELEDKKERLGKASERRVEVLAQTERNMPEGIKMLKQWTSEETENKFREWIQLDEGEKRKCPFVVTVWGKEKDWCR